MLGKWNSNAPPDALNGRHPSSSRITGSSLVSRIPPPLSPGLFLFEGVDQFNGREEADFPAVMLNGLDAEGGSDIGFSGARAADQNDILRPIHERAAVQRPDGGLVDFAGGKVEAGEVLAGRKAGRLHVTGDGANLAFGQFGLQQLRQHRDAIVGQTIPRIVCLPSSYLKSRCALPDQIGDGPGHAMHLQTAEHDDNGTGGRIMTHGGLRRSGCAGRHGVRHWPWACDAVPGPTAYPVAARQPPCHRPTGTTGSAHGSWSARPWPATAPRR